MKKGAILILALILLISTVQAEVFGGDLSRRVSESIEQDKTPIFDTECAELKEDMINRCKSETEKQFPGEHGWAVRTNVIDTTYGENDCLDSDLFDEEGENPHLVIGESRLKNAGLTCHIVCIGWSCPIEYDPYTQCLDYPIWDDNKDGSDDFSGLTEAEISKNLVIGKGDFQSIKTKGWEFWKPKKEKVFASGPITTSLAGECEDRTVYETPKWKFWKKDVECKLENSKVQTVTSKDGTKIVRACGTCNCADYYHFDQVINNERHLSKIKELLPTFPKTISSGLKRLYPEKFA
ncbi:hypothetical protein ACFLZZ_03700 [Nanoarchaeota archaeon]